jgi:hypothetical protein
MIKPLIMRLEATDTTGQRLLEVADAAVDVAVGSLLEDTLVPRMQLPRFDSTGRRLTYHALLDRESRHLHASEIVGEACLPNDRLVLQPDIDAGSGIAGDR